MTEFNKQEQLTTADLAPRRGNSDPKLEDAISEYQEEYIAANPHRPGVVNPDLRNEAIPGIPETPASRDWDATRPIADAAHANSAPHTTAAPLFSEADVGDLRLRWSDVQSGFVDEPRRSVKEADQLVATVIERLAEGFANERASLEKHWDRGDNVSTEDLRVALQRYRAFFGRLLNAA